MNARNFGTVIWITGISSSGKTTIAHAVASKMRLSFGSIVLLDGDEFRKVIDDRLGHSVEERVTNAFRLSRMCKLLSSQGITVVCSTMSLFPQVWEWNRRNISQYVEIYLRVSMETAQRRDSKFVYVGSSNVVGKDIILNVPPNPDLTIDNDDTSPEQFQERVDQIISLAVSKF